MSPETSSTNHTHASSAFIWLMAIACGFSVANLYYNQPLLADMARTFGKTVRDVGAVPMLTQTGYALGMLLIVPLGDRVQRKRLVPALLVLVAIALAATALSPSFLALTIASFTVGATTVVPQILIPLTGQVANPAQRGHALGIVMMGLLLGVLLSRTVSGAVDTYYGWRAIYWFAAGLMLLLAPVLGRILPTHAVHTDVGYAQLLRSVLTLVHTQPVLREAMLNGGLLFGALSAFWATLVFRLETPPLHYGAREAGLFGVIGAVGALAAPVVGRIADRVPPRSIITIMTALLLASYIVFWLFGTTLTGLAAGVILLDLAVQGAQVSNMTRIYSLPLNAASRLASAFMIAYFVGGAVGSFLGTFMWSIAEWSGVSATGAVLASIALVTHVLAGRREDQVARISKQPTSG